MTDRVENSLREFFTENAFKPGDPLPNEQEIAQRLNVSRNVVREALSRLRMLGMIETRPRRGMVMAQPDPLASIEKVLNPLILSQSSLNDIFELRLILEMGIADFLFARKTAKALDELELIVEKQKKLPLLSKEDEIEFHGKLYDMTGNETFQRFQSLLFPVFEHVFTSLSKPGGHAVIKDPVSHYDLFKILKEGTSEEFQQAMRIHLSVYYNTIKA